MSKRAMRSFAAVTSLLLVLGSGAPARATAVGTLTASCNLHLEDFPAAVADRDNTDTDNCDSDFGPEGDPGEPFGRADGTVAGLTNNGTAFVWTANGDDAFSATVHHGDTCAAAEPFPFQGNAHGVISIGGSFASPVSAGNETFRASYIWVRLGLTAIISFGVDPLDAGDPILGIDENGDGDVTDAFDSNMNDGTTLPVAVGLLIPREDRPHAGAVNTCPADPGDDPFDVTVLGVTVDLEI